jgi:hypothetical protein
MAPKKNEKSETADGTKFDPETGVVDEVEVLDDEAMFGSDAHDATPGGLTVKQIKLPAGKSVYGFFRGFLPFEYEDKKDATRGKVALNWVIIEVAHPTTKKPIGITGKIMGTVRIINDLAVAEPGDLIRIARHGQIELGRNRMWDDTVTIWPVSNNRASIALARNPVSNIAELKQWNDGVRKALPGAPIPRETPETTDAEHALNAAN